MRKARLRYLTRAEAEQRRGSTGASGGEQRRLRRRCCKVEEGRVEAVRVRGELGRVECLLIGVEWRWRGEGAGGRGVNGGAVEGSPAPCAHRAAACAARRDVTRRGGGVRRRRRCSGVNGGLQAAWGTEVQGVAWPVRVRASVARRPWRVRVVGPMRTHRSWDGRCGSARRVLAEGSAECGAGSKAVASGAALGLVRRAAAAAERARAREGERGRAGRGTALAAVGRGRGPCGVRAAEQEG